MTKEDWRRLIEHPAYIVIGLLGSVASIVALMLGSPAGFVIAIVVTAGICGFYYWFHAPNIPLEVIDPVPVTPMQVIEAAPVAANTNVEPEKNWFDCAYCDGRGWVVLSSNGYQTEKGTCGVCGGHGQLFLDSWNQPPCRRCNGSGKLTSWEQNRLQYFEHTQPCEVCRGSGKRPRLQA